MAFLSSSWHGSQIACFLILIGGSLAAEENNLFDLDKVDCGENFTTPSGNFSGDLGSNATHCVWRVMLSAASQTSTIFKLLKLSDGDVIKVYDGAPAAGDANMVVNITGKHDVFVAVTFSNEIYIDLAKSAKTISLTFQYSPGCNVGLLEYANRVVSPAYLPNRGSLECQYKLTGLPQARDKVAALAFTLFKVTNGNLTVTDGNQTVAIQGSEGTLPNDYISKETQDLTPSLILNVNFKNSSTVQKFEAFFSSVDKKCSGVMNVSAVSNFTINIPSDQSPLTDCRIILVSEQDTTILMNLTKVRLTAGADRITVNDGGSLGSPAVTDLTAMPMDGYLVASSKNKLWLRVVVGELTGERTVGFSISERDQGGRFYENGNVTLKKNATFDDTYFQFVVQDGEQVVITFNNNVTMFPNSSLDLYDGTQPGGSLLTSLTTQKQFFPVTSSGSSLLLVARNFANQETFSAQYQFINQSCSQVSAASTGSYVLESTSENLCRWTIRPTNSVGIVTLNIDSLRLGVNQSLTVYSGVMEFGVLLATFDLNTTDQQLPRFSAPVNSGIELVYQSKNTCSNCSKPVVQASYRTEPGCNGIINASTGVISSPNYPDSYSINTDCVWYLTTNASSNTTRPPHLLYVAFSDLQLGQGHWVRIKDTTNSSAKVLADYRGSTLPADIILATNSSAVEFSATPDFSSNSVQTGRGFKANYWNLDCGGNFTTRNASGQFTTPNWPKAVTNSTLCVWIIQFPVSGRNSTVRNSVQFQLVVAQQNKNMSNGALSIHDGGSVRDPVMQLKFKGGQSGTVIARTNTIVVVYNYTADPGQNEAGLTVAFNFSAFSCWPADQCGGKGVCIHPDWVCNGVDDCGDMTDERNCTTVNGKTSGLVASYWIVVCLLLGLLFGVVLAFLIPAIYRRIKYPNYRHLRDISEPVIT